MRWVTEVLIVRFDNTAKRNREALQLRLLLGHDRSEAVVASARTTDARRAWCTVCSLDFV
jgi:hypothetical protein